MGQGRLVIATPSPHAILRPFPPEHGTVSQ